MLKWGRMLPGWRGDRAGQEQQRSSGHSSRSTKGEGESEEHATNIYTVSQEGNSWQLVINVCNLHPMGSTVTPTCSNFVFSGSRPREGFLPNCGLQGACSPPSTSLFSLRHSSGTEKPDPQTAWHWEWSCPKAAVTLPGHHLGSLWNPISPSSLHTCSVLNSSLGPASSWAAFRETRRTGFSIEMTVGFTLFIDIILKMKNGGQEWCGYFPKSSNYCRKLIQKDGPALSVRSAEPAPASHHPHLHSAHGGGNREQFFSEHSVLY